MAPTTEELQTQDASPSLKAVQRATEELAISDDARWDRFVATHPQAHVLQTSRWGAFKGRFDWQADRVFLSAATGEICSGASILYKPLLPTQFLDLKLAYVPKGPLVDWHNVAETKTLLRAVEDRCRRQGAGILKIEPDLSDTAQNRQLLASYGFRPSPQTVQPQSTVVLDIGDSEKAILARMKSKWRYNVRLAKKKGITVREGTAADLATFHELMQTTGARDGFFVHSPAYFDAAFELFVPDCATYLFAEFEGRPLASIVLFHIGDTVWYLWGASSNRERNRMPNHALQWAAIQWARERGATRYDLWGIPDPIGQVAAALPEHGDVGVPALDLPIDLTKLPHGDLWGVYRLKQGFGGNVVRFVGAWDKPLSASAYSLYTTGLAARKAVPVIKNAVKEQVQRVKDQFSSAGEIRTDDVASISGVQVKEIHTIHAWQAALQKLPHPHVLQSWEWGMVKGQTGWQAERYAVLDGANEIGAFQFLTRQPMARLPVRIGYLPKGPVVDWGNARHVDRLVAQIEDLARQRNCLFVKIDPDVRIDQIPGQQLRNLLISRGWRFSHEQIQFQNTALSNLYPSEQLEEAEEEAGEEKILAHMKNKWRYNIRLAKKRGIQIRTIQEYAGGSQDLREFYRLYAETGARDGFLIRPIDYYISTWQTFLDAQGDAGNPAGGALLLAEHEEEASPIAGLFLMRYGRRAWYFYGASSGQRRRDMPNHLLQYEAMRWARNQGCTTYDWWGAPTDLDDPDDRMQGVWNFKKGFGAEFQPHIGAWDFPVSPLLYGAYRELLPRVIEAMRKLR